MISGAIIRSFKRRTEANGIPDTIALKSKTEYPARRQQVILFAVFLHPIGYWGIQKLTPLFCAPEFMSLARIPSSDNSEVEFLEKSGE